MLNLIEVERQLNARRLEIEALQLALNQLKGRIPAETAATAVTETTISYSSNDSDSYPVAGGILHKLKHTFIQLATFSTATFGAAVTFATTILVTGIATFTAAPVFSSGTASRPVKLTAGKALTTALIDLSSTSDITGTTQVENGGTERATLTAFAVLVGNGVAPVALISPSTSGFVLTDNGAGANPSFATVPAPSASNINTGVLGQAYGGTGFNAISTSNLRDQLSVPTKITVAATTIILAKITGGGVNGSITWNADGLVTAYVDPT